MEMPRVTRRTVSVLVVFFIGMLAVSLYESAAYTAVSEQTEISQNESAALSDDTAADSRIIVYVSGAVIRPGVVSLSEGARVYEAVEACGGVLPTADSASINLAAQLQDGIHINVGEKTLNQATAAGDIQIEKVNSAVADSSGLININTADEQALTKINGVGPKMAAAIIEYRQREGSFQSLEDLKKVTGIGEKKFERISSQVTL